MRANDLIVPTVPVSYVLLMLDIAADHGVHRETLLDGLAITPEMLQKPDARVSLLADYARLCIRALKHTGEPALGYEFGLRSTLTTHGILGYGLMSQARFRDMLTFAQRFGATLRMPAWQLRFYEDGDHAVMEGQEAIAHGSLRRFSCEQLVVSMYSIAQQLLPVPDPEIELLFDYPEPEYHARYRDRLPRARFSTSRTQIRVPAAYLDMPLRTADQVSALLAERECERELSLLSRNRDLVNQVRAVLVNDGARYPTLEQVAERLHTSTRTLNRQLEKRGSGFRELLAEARQRDSLRLLEDPRLTLTDIAQQLGYSSLANFARAFRVWNGASPGEFRARSESRN